MTDMKIINCTPHPIILNDGTTFEVNEEFKLRVPNTYSNTDDMFPTIGYGELEGLPAETEGVFYIVSSIVKLFAPNRKDLLIPATNHKDCVRDEKGFIVSVPFLCR